MPTRNILPASASFDRWHTTSAAEIEVVQAQVEVGVANRFWSDQAGPEEFTIAIGERRYRARCGRLGFSLGDAGLVMRTGTRDCAEDIEVAQRELANATDVGAQVLRVAARRLSAGGVELGLQRLIGGRWEALRQPARPVLTGLSRSSWRFTSVLELPPLPAYVFGELRRGASITTRDGEFDLEVDGRVYRTRCGVLELDILTEHILADTAAEGCHDSAPLLTICPTSDCDVQQNAAYEWESRQVGASLERIEITRSEAQAVVNAIFADFFPRSRAPAVSFSSEQSHGHAGRNEIVLGTSVRNLGAVIHELAHSLVDRANVRDVGHGGAFTAMLLYLWERYFPIADVQAARDDAERHGIEVASRSPIQTRFSEARRVIGELFCDWRRDLNGPDLCDAASGAMSGQLDAEVAGLYVGWGSKDGMWWSARADDETGRIRSYIALDSNEQSLGTSVARLSLECNTEDELEADVWWRGVTELPSILSYRFGDGEWQIERWQTLTGGTWGDDTWATHRAPDSVAFLQLLNWHAASDASLIVRYEQRGRFHQVSFGLADVFDTPVQPNLVQCGTDRSSLFLDAPVIDWGRYGEDFFWGVDESKTPLKSYVVRDTTIAQTGSQARLSIRCENDQLQVDVYWEVRRDLDWTIRYRLNDGPVQTEEWISGWGTWGDTEYKWTGLEEAGNLVAELAWAAQSNGKFTVQSRDRHDPSETYTATFDLDGLFETPIQPNLARCGR